MALKRAGRGHETGGIAETSNGGLMVEGLKVRRLYKHFLTWFEGRDKHRTKLNLGPSRLCFVPLWSPFIPQPSHKTC
jgi:hypothetical protein